MIPAFPFELQTISILHVSSYILFDVPAFGRLLAQVLSTIKTNESIFAKTSDDEE